MTGLLGLGGDILSTEWYFTCLGYFMCISEMCLMRSYKEGKCEGQIDYLSSVHISTTQKPVDNDSPCF